MDTSVPVAASRVPTTFPDVPLERYWIPQEVFFRHPRGGGIHRLLAYLKYPGIYPQFPYTTAQNVTVLARDDGELMVVPTAELPLFERIPTSPNRVGYHMPEGYFEILCEGRTHNLGVPEFSSVSTVGVNDRTMMLYQDIKTEAYLLSHRCLNQMERVYQK